MEMEVCYIRESFRSRGAVELCGETQIDSTHPCVWSVTSECGQRTSRVWTLFGALLIGERSTCLYTVDGEDIRSSGLVNGRLVMDYAPRCRCSVQVNR
jgi:hypothetical protein